MMPLACSHSEFQNSEVLLQKLERLRINKPQVTEIIEKPTAGRSANRLSRSQPFPTVLMVAPQIRRWERPQIHLPLVVVLQESLV
jgi:hypothetical protein